MNETAAAYRVADKMNSAKGVSVATGDVYARTPERIHLVRIDGCVPNKYVESRTCGTPHLAVLPLSTEENIVRFLVP